MNNPLFHTIYQWLFQEYGPLGWWPLLRLPKRYHPGDYNYPQTSQDIYEICLGAILTQNTTWRQAETALMQLKAITDLDPNLVLTLDENRVKEAITPARYANSKYRYLCETTRFYLDFSGRTPCRDEILVVKGIGNETADCILLYGFKQLEFVIDAYTQRMFHHYGLIQTSKYLEIKSLFENNLPKDLILYQEYHALIVCHATRFYSRKPYGLSDPIVHLLK